MTRIEFNITPHHQGKCICHEFREPLTTWEEIAERHKSYSLMAAHFSFLSNDGEEWITDLFRCLDCGRYWVREHCGAFMVTPLYYFFYYVGTVNPEELLNHATYYPVLRHLDRNDQDYKTLIKPHLSID